MRRLSFVYVLIPAVLLAAGSLAYYGYSYSNQLAARERLAILGMMGELAKEKVIGIQTLIADADQVVLDAVDFGDLPHLGKTIKATSHRSVSLFGLDKEVISGGRYRKPDNLSGEKFSKLLGRVLDDLNVEQIPRNHTRYLQREYDGRLYLFSCTRLRRQGREYLVVLEEEISYLLLEVFPAFFDVKSANLYQVVNEKGDLVYGYAFSGLPTEDMVEVRFRETLPLWRLRVAQRDAEVFASTKNRQKTIDLVLISGAMAVIAIGLAVMAIAVRRERRLSQLKSDFISNVSHELKTPLSIISMFGELLEMGRVKSPEQATEYAQIIRRESTRLSSLIDNVLDFAKIEKGKAPYTFADDQSMTEVVSRALESCAPRLAQAHMEVDYEEPVTLPTLRMDSNAMVLAILNLLDNAIKYAADGKRIELSLQEVDNGVELIVRDFGAGIGKDEEANVFERFYRSKSVRLKPIRGSGIGLSLVRHIVLAHKGTIEIDSKTKPGCAFRLWLPAR